jgi:Fur family zinc uptake transcriptional regulator
MQAKGGLQVQTDAWMSELRDRGYRVTGKRRDILQYLLESDRYVSARELIDHMRARYPTMSLETVYRNLHTLRDENIIEESDFADHETRYRIACREGHHHHFICVCCGRTTVIDHCPMPDIGRVPPGFRVLQHRFEVLGCCEDCTEADRSTQT